MYLTSGVRGASVLNANRGLNKQIIGRINKHPATTKTFLDFGDFHFGLRVRPSLSGSDSSKRTSLYCGSSGLLSSLSAADMMVQFKGI